jgi:hypothetical protein
MAARNDEWWIEEELGGLELGDVRLERRVKKVVGDWAANPTGSIPAFSQDWAATKAAYRLLENPAVEEKALQEAQWLATRKRLAGHELVLCIQDTTDIDVSAYSSMEGRGSLPRGKGKRKGILVHTTFAVSSSGVPLGVLTQYNYVRQVQGEDAGLGEKEAGKKDERGRASKRIEEKESKRWLLGESNSKTEQLPGQLLFVSDRESDIADYFVQERPAHVQLLVRSQHNRKLVDEEQKLWEVLEQQASNGRMSVAVSRQKGRSARKAECEVRYRAVTLQPPNTNRRNGVAKLAPIPLYAIAVTERAGEAGSAGAADAAGQREPLSSAPTGDGSVKGKQKKRTAEAEDEREEAKVTPICWRLLTTYPVASLEDALLLVKYYSMRWYIERFHYVLKSGCNIEMRRLDHIESLQRLLALANFVAWRLLWLTHLARLEPDAPCTVALADAEWKALHVATTRSRTLPKEPPTLREALRAIAKLGGFLARRSDGEPGVTVLWRGWQRLTDLTRMWLIMQSESSN